MKIYYWSPFTSKVATIKAVINSAYSVKKLFNYDTFIIDSFGEWKIYNQEIRDKKIRLIKTNHHLSINNTKGYLLSRLAYIKIFIFSFVSLKKLLQKKKPEYLIIHLITSLPIILFILFKFDTKLILRISGMPKLNIFRKILWRIAKNRVCFVTTPTIETLKNLKKEKIFQNKKIFFLPDPVFIKEEILIKKKKIQYQNYILNIGRLTRQKNQEILIKGFKEISKKNKKLKLIILGSGEKYHYLKQLSKNLCIQKKIIFLGHVTQPYQYIKNALCVFITSLWEDPGFVMIESAALKKSVICSDCKSGPKEFYNKGKNGFLFKNNNLKSLLRKFNEFINTNQKVINYRLIKNYNKALDYSELEHGKQLNKLLKYYEKK